MIFLGRKDNGAFVVSKIRRKTAESKEKVTIVLMSDGRAWERWTKNKIKGDWKYIARWRQEGSCDLPDRFLAVFLSGGWKKKQCYSS